MNRRTFIKHGTFGAIGSAILPLTSFIPSSPTENKEKEDIFEIFSPDDIKWGWGEDAYLEHPPLPTPNFKYNKNKNHWCCVRCWKLKFRVYESSLFSATSKERSIWRRDIFMEINSRLHLTHIHSIRFAKIPLKDPYGDSYYTSYVHGTSYIESDRKHVELLRFN
jgi:hypothetical protein